MNESREGDSVAYDRGLVAEMLGELVYDDGYGMKSRSAYTVEAIAEQSRLLREADNRDAAGVHTARLASPSAAAVGEGPHDVAQFHDAWVKRYGSTDDMACSIYVEGCPNCPQRFVVEYLEARLGAVSGITRIVRVRRSVAEQQDWQESTLREAREY